MARYQATKVLAATSPLEATAQEASHRPKGAGEDTDGETVEDEGGGLASVEGEGGGGAGQQGEGGGGAEEGGAGLQQHAEQGTYSRSVIMSDIWNSAES